MFGNQLAILSLWLVGLSLSNNLSEAARPNPNELFLVLRHSTNFIEIYNAFMELGRDYRIYVDLTDVRKENCTPNRILFNNRHIHLFGDGARQYVTSFVELQRRVCEDTFIERLARQYELYQTNWPGKGAFQEFINFVVPWPTFGMNWDAFKQSVEVNIQSYIDWREMQNPSPRSRDQIHSWVIRSSIKVFKFLGSFSATMRANANFEITLDYEQAHAVALGMIADAVGELNP